MRKGLFLHTSVLSFFFILSTSFLGAATEWSYTGKTGPEHWKNLNPKFAQAVGTRQSPINITSNNIQEKRNLNLNYKMTNFTLLNNGHTVEMIPEDKESNFIILKGDKFILQQIHFHTPAEHQVDGKTLDMEVHLVHQNSKGELAVIGILLKRGRENRTLRETFSLLPEKNGQIVKLPSSFNAQNLFPKNFKYVEYAGSLTTPPTREIVSWIVLKDVGTVSARQIRAFTEIIGENARPVQPSYERTIVKHKF